VRSYLKEAALVWERRGAGRSSATTQREKKRVGGKLITAVAGNDKKKKKVQHAEKAKSLRVWNREKKWKCRMRKTARKGLRQLYVLQNLSETQKVSGGDTKCARPATKRGKGR